MATAQPQSTRRRLLLRMGTVGVVAAVAVLLATVALARFTTTKSTQTSSTFSSGTVSLTNNVTGACGVANMLPSAAPAACTLKATYGGSLPAWVSVNVLIETQAGNGGTKLYNPSDSAHDLQVTLTSTSPTVTYAVPVTATTCPGGAPSGSTCYELDNELVSAMPVTSSSSATTFTVAVSLPAGTTTGYRGGAAQVVLTAHAAQSGNNAATGCTAGQTCAAAHWS